MYIIPYIKNDRKIYMYHIILLIVFIIGTNFINSYTKKCVDLLTRTLGHVLSLYPLTSKAL